MHLVSAGVNPIVPAWYDIGFSVIPLIVVALVVIAMVSLVRRWRALSVVEAALWTAAIVFVPLVGAAAWFIVGCRATDRRWEESPQSRALNRRR